MAKQKRRKWQKREIELKHKVLANPLHVGLPFHTYVCIAKGVRRLLLLFSDDVVYEISYNLLLNLLLIHFSP